MPTVETIRGVRPDPDKYQQTEFHCTSDTGSEVVICFEERLDLDDPDVIQYVREFAQKRFDTLQDLPSINKRFIK